MTRRQAAHAWGCWSRAAARRRATARTTRRSTRCTTSAGCTRCWPTTSRGCSPWLRVRAEAEDVERRFAAALSAGLPPHDPSVLAIAEEHRQHLSRSLYAGSPEMHTGLAGTYVADERFTAHDDRVAPGLARYVLDAVHANRGGAVAAG